MALWSPPTDFGAKPQSRQRSFVKSFHGLRPFLTQWEPGTRFPVCDFDIWASGLEKGDGRREAAQFVLHCCSPKQSWLTGKFCFLDAWRAWDDDHQEAFKRWLEDPVVF